MVTLNYLWCWWFSRIRPLITQKNVRSCENIQTSREITAVFHWSNSIFQQPSHESEPQMNFFFFCGWFRNLLFDFWGKARTNKNAHSQNHIFVCGICMCGSVSFFISCSCSFLPQSKNMHMRQISRDAPVPKPASGITADTTTPIPVVYMCVWMWQFSKHLWVTLSMKVLAYNASWAHS